MTWLTLKKDKSFKDLITNKIVLMTTIFVSRKFQKEQEFTEADNCYNSDNHNVILQEIIYQNRHLKFTTQSDLTQMNVNSAEDKASILLCQGSYSLAQKFWKNL